MSVYEIVEILIKNNRKTKEELLTYCKTFFQTKKITETEYNKLADMLD